jgi:excisionase family DNA binding protein
MTNQHLSMREASRVLGVSQLRVRELLRKGTLLGQKIADEAGERWTIAAESVHSYLERRPAKASENGHGPSGAERALADVIAATESYLAHLRHAQRDLEAELARAQARTTELRRLEAADPAELARRAVEAAKKAVEAAKQAEPRKKAEPEPPKAEPAKAEPKATAEPKAPKPEPVKAAAPKATKPKPAKKEPVKAKAAPAKKTAVGAALERAGVGAKAAKKPAKKK